MSCIFITVKRFTQAVNIPALNLVLNFSDITTYEFNLQLAGRLTRAYPGKEVVKLYIYNPACLKPFIQTLQENHKKEGKSFTHYESYKQFKKDSSFNPNAICAVSMQGGNMNFLNASEI